MPSNAVNTSIAAIVVGMLAPAVARAADADSNSAATPEPFIDLHAFVSQGALKSSSNNYLAYTHAGSVDFTEVAVNGTKQLSDTLRVGIQFFVSRIGPQGTFDPTLDWLYLDWHRYDWLSFRAGRIKIPIGLYNEQTDFDPGHLTVLMPQSIYPITDRDFLLAATGVQLYGYIGLTKGGALSYNVVGGAIFVNADLFAPLPATTNVPYTLVGRLIWETPVTGLRVAGSALAAELDLTTVLNNAPIAADVKAIIWVTSVEYAAGRLRLAGEYGHWNTTIISDAQSVVPSGTTVSERFYVDGDYSLTHEVGLGLYYSTLFPDIAHRSGSPQNYQDDLAATVRWDITLHWLVKLEAHYMHGTAALTSALNGGNPLSALTPDWALVLAKVTAYF